MYSLNKCLLIKVIDSLCSQNENFFKNLQKNPVGTAQVTVKVVRKRLQKGRHN